MDENRKNDQVDQELEPEELEQVSGGRQYQIKIRYCPKCNDITTWLFRDGVWACGICGYGENTPYNNL